MPLRADGAFLGIGRLRKGNGPGVSRLSLRLVSTPFSAVSSVIVTFLRVVLVSSRVCGGSIFYFFSFVFGVRSYRGCGGFASSLF